MPDIWMDVDTALAEVPVNIFPLVDDTDFKTIEGAVAYNAAGLSLRWHFVTCAGAYTVTSVTPTSGGDYDWTDHGDSGIYTIEIPASGGGNLDRVDSAVAMISPVIVATACRRNARDGVRSGTGDKVPPQGQACGVIGDRPLDGLEVRVVDQGKYIDWDFS